MLTKIQNLRINYLSRILILPLFAFVVLAFSVKTKTIASNEISFALDKKNTVNIDAGPFEGYGSNKVDESFKARIPFKLNKKVTVVIDAGHGGDDGGVKVDELFEKELTLQIAQQIKALNKNENIEIVLTRTDDATLSLQNRAAIINNQKPDLLISIHVNAAPSIKNANGSKGEIKANGFEARIHQATSFYDQSKLLGSTLMQSLSDIYKTAPVFKQSQQNRFILKEALCPAIIIECGYLTNNSDRTFIQQPANQKRMAQKILAGIEMYLSADAGSYINEPTTDTLPKKKEINEVNVKEKNVEVIYKDGTKEELSVQEAYRRNIITINAKQNSVSINSPSIPTDALIIVDGKPYKKDLKTLNPNNIQSLNVIKGTAAISKYGDEGKNGVIEFTMKKVYKNSMISTVDSVTITGRDNDNSFQITHIELSNIRKDTTDKDYGMTFTKTEIDPQFEGGSPAWRTYLIKNLNTDAPVKNKAPKGTYPVIVQFIVEKDGSISDIKAVTKHGYGMENEVMRLIETSPKWLPAKQNGKIVRAYKKQPVTFAVSN